MKHGKCCCVPNCKVLQTGEFPGTHFYRFPTGEFRWKRRQQWILEQ